MIRMFSDSDHDDKRLMEIEQQHIKKNNMTKREIKRQRRPRRGVTLLSALTLTACLSVGHSANTPIHHHVRAVEVSNDGGGMIDTTEKTNQTSPFLYAERIKELRQKAKEERKERFYRRQERKSSAARSSFLQKLSSNVHTHTLEQVNTTELLSSDSRRRQLNWFGGSGSGGAYSSGVLADPTQYYDKWAQAYRMLGGYIDCDHDKSDDSHDSKDNNGNNNGGDQNSACSRWMLWASVRLLVVCLSLTCSFRLLTPFCCVVCQSQLPR